MASNDATIARTSRLRSEVVAIGASVLFAVCVAALHGLRTDLPPDLHMLSEYALGATGWVMMIAFLALAVGFFALASALRRDLHGWLGTVGLIATGLAGLGSTLGGLFPMDPLGTPAEHYSTSAKLHEIAFMIGGPGALLAATFVNISLTRNPVWRSSRVTLVWTAALVWTVTIAFGTSMASLMNQPTAADLPPVGLWNRALVSSWIVWIIALALRSIRHSKAAS